MHHHNVAPMCEVTRAIFLLISYRSFDFSYRLLLGHFHALNISYYIFLYMIYVYCCSLTVYTRILTSFLPRRQLLLLLGPMVGHPSSFLAPDGGSASGTRVRSDCLIVRAEVSQLVYIYIYIYMMNTYHEHRAPM